MTGRLTTVAVAVFCLALPLRVSAQDPELSGQNVQELVDHAVTLDITRPAEEALEYIDSIQHSLHNATPEQLARLKLIQARSQALLGNHDTGLEILGSLLETELRPEQRLRALELAANLAMNAGRFSVAFDFLNQGLVHQESVDDPALKSGIFGLAAYWHTQMGDQQKGMEYAQRTLSLARQSGDVREICVALEKLGQAQEIVGLHEQALATYESGLKACEQAQDPVFTGVLHNLVGRLLHRMDRSSEAEDWMQMGIEKARESGFEDGITEAMTTYSRFLLDQQRYEEASALLQETLRRINPDNRLQNYADVQLMLGRISHHHGDYETAYTHLSEYLQAREKIMDSERAKHIAFQEVQFDALTREQEIRLLREQARVSALQQEAGKQQQLIRQMGYIIAIFVLLLLVFLLIRAIRDRRYFRHMSAHDGLTGLLNHTSFLKASEPLVAQSQSSIHPLTLVLADIDYFKQFNDIHGHLAGDAVLRQVARCLTRVFSRYGPVGRIGGEEFAVCLADTDLARAVELVGQLRQTLQDCKLKDLDRNITMSYGVAQLDAGEDLDSLRLRTDQALYQAKNAGRDRLVMADVDSVRTANT